MKSSLLLLFLFSASFFAYAQPADTIPSNIRYFNSWHQGVLIGKKGDGLVESFAMIHGIRIRKFAVGIGVGYEPYEEWRALPVFGSASYDLFRVRHNPLFIQLNAGYAKAWYAPDDEAALISGKTRGPCFHPLMGYRVERNKFNIYLTVGYKFQTINYEHTVQQWGWGGGLNRIYVSRNIQRVSIRLGFGFR